MSSQTVAEKIRAEIKRLVDDEGPKLGKFLDQKNHGDFAMRYQRWYTDALKVVQTFAPDRYHEFVSFYLPDPKRKSVDVTTYVIQDFIRGFGPKDHLKARGDFWDVYKVTSTHLWNQANILDSILGRVDSVVADLIGTVSAGLEDSTLDAAMQMKKTNLRASGAIAGVVLEGHLQRVVQNRSLSIPKKNPTLADLNDSLKSAGVYDTTTWRKIQLLADIRNICVHQKGSDPTPGQIDDLLSGVNWAIKEIH